MRLSILSACALLFATAVTSVSAVSCGIAEKDNVFINSKVYEIKNGVAVEQTFATFFDFLGAPVTRGAPKSQTAPTITALITSDQVKLFGTCVKGSTPAPVTVKPFPDRVSDPTLPLYDKLGACPLPNRSMVWCNTVENPPYAPMKYEAGGKVIPINTMAQYATFQLSDPITRQIYSGMCGNPLLACDTTTADQKCNYPDKSIVICPENPDLYSITNNGQAQTLGAKYDLAAQAKAKLISATITPGTCQALNECILIAQVAALSAPKV